MKMDCHISDGPQEPDDEHSYSEPDGDEAYDIYRQRCVDDGVCSTLGCERPHLATSIFCGECAHAGAETLADLHTKVGEYTGTLLYSYDQRYWWSTPDTAYRMFLKTKDRNHD